MNDAEFFAMVADKYGLPGAILSFLGWAIYRFGLKPNSNPVSNETAEAIEKLSGKMDAFRDSLSGQVSQIDRRLIRVETKMEDKR